MSKKGFFNFLKGWSNVSDDENNQTVATTTETVSEKKNISTLNSEATEEIETFVVEKFKEMIDLCGFVGNVRPKKKDGNRLYIEVYDTEEDAGRIIGKGGHTLESFQILLRHFVIRRFDSAIRITIDAGDYRNKRVGQLKMKALKAAEDVEKNGKPVELDPMTASERRAIHVLFENNDIIETLSEGQGDDRHIVLVRRDA